MYKLNNVIPLIPKKEKHTIYRVSLFKNKLLYARYIREIGMTPPEPTGMPVDVGF